MFAPELDISEWFNTPEPISLESLRGRVVMLHAFQMLCPGCVLHGTPLAQRIHGRFAGPDLVVVGLHTVFEHHAAMTPVSLQAYLHEFRVTMPIGVDRHDGRGIPKTMEVYAMRGTPSLVIIDRAGSVRHHLFGQVDEIELGMHLARLIDE
jgi:AhpC/TSA family